MYSRLFLLLLIKNPMKTILNAFNTSTAGVENNFYFSFLALNFGNQRPFKNDVILPVLDLSQNKMTATFLNSFSLDKVNEYGNSIRRHFLNDMVIVYETYSSQMFSSHKNGQTLIKPETINNRHLGADKFEQLSDIYTSDELTFLSQLRKLRNSIVHYNGNYAETQPLDYTFGTEIYNSAGKIGQGISIKFDNILWIFEELKTIVNSGNKKYFLNYP
jgi:hypothetical protein